MNIRRDPSLNIVVRTRRHFECCRSGATCTFSSNTLVPRRNVIFNRNVIHGNIISLLIPNVRPLSHNRILFSPSPPFNFKGLLVRRPPRITRLTITTGINSVHLSIVPRVIIRSCRQNGGTIRRVTRPKISRPKRGPCRRRPTPVGRGRSRET